MKLSVPLAYSQIGKRVLKCPPGCLVQVSPAPSGTSGASSLRQRVTVTGPLGALHKDFESFVSITSVQGSVEDTLGNSVDGGKGSLKPEDSATALSVSVANPDIKKQKAMWGTARALLGNMVEGVTDGFNLSLRLVGVGYRAALEKNVETGGDRIILRLGYAHPIYVPIPPGINVTIPVPQRILLSGCDWESLTGFAATIRKWRKPEPYNQKGIFVGDETIKKKEGKKR